MHDDFESVSPFFPCLYHLNQRDDLRILKLGKNAKEIVYMEREAILDPVTNYFANYIHPYTLKFVFPIFIEYYLKGDNQKVCTGVQMIKTKNTWTDFLTVTKINQDKTNLVSMSMPLQKLGNTSLIAQAIQDNEFIRDHFEKFMSLTPREKQILELVADGCSNTEIGSRLFISQHTVRTHRNRFFEKLDIKSFRDIIK